MTSANRTPGQPEERRDFRRDVTDKIVAMLEEGVAPWQKPWESTSAMPLNPTTDRLYRGGNAIHLMASATLKGYADPRWMTYKQAANNEWQVKQGERGTQIEFWDPAPRKDFLGIRQANSETDAKQRFIHRVYTVFNASQIDGVPPLEKKQHTPFEVAEAGEEIIQKSGAKLRHDQPDRAFYSRKEDTIHLPLKESFQDAPGYYSTALHELAHWTGHPERLNRATLNESYSFGDPNYAKEELRAELTSLFLAAEKGIPHNPASHASYVGSWIEALRQDKHEIFRAAHDAAAATDFLLAFERDQALSYENKPASLTKGALAADGLAEAASMAKRLLGPTGKAWSPDQQSGLYRGPVVAETATQLLQQVSSRSVIAHEKTSLTDPPSVGDNVAIIYSGGGPGEVRENRQRARGQEIGR